jgi:hypothetical protein
MLRALADAGHRVDVIAPTSDISDHPHIRYIDGTSGQRLSRYKMRLIALKSVSQVSYDAVHAVDDAVLFVSRLCRIRKIRLIYEATRCFTGVAGSAPSLLWKLFSRHAQRREKGILLQSAATLTPCKHMTEDLSSIAPDSTIVQIENIPLQSLVAGKETERSALLKKFKVQPATIVVCSVLPGNSAELNKILMTARKVVETLPATAFFFRGIKVDAGKTVAAKLDILDHCVFFGGDETEDYLAALDVANAAWFISDPKGRYAHPEIFTLLNSPAPLVAVDNGVHDHLLSPANSVEVLRNTGSMVEALIQVIQEPLFSLGLATEGQQLVADHYSLSSFKHKVRMTYHEILNR